MHHFESIDQLLDCADNVVAHMVIMFPNLDIDYIRAIVIDYLLTNSTI